MKQFNAVFLVCLEAQKRFKNSKEKFDRNKVAKSCLHEVSIYELSIYYNHNDTSLDKWIFATYDSIKITDAVSTKHSAQCGVLIH